MLGAALQVLSISEFITSAARMGLLQLRSCAETRAHTSLCSSQRCSTQETSFCIPGNCTRALLPAQTCRARHTSPTTSMAANPPQGTRSKGSTRSIACTGPASSQPGKGLGLHSCPWKRSQTPAAQMPVVQGILSPIFGDTRTLILTRPFAELPVNLSCLKLKFCDLFIFVKLWDTTAEHANIA